MQVWDVFEAGSMPPAPVRQPSAGLLRAASAGLGSGALSPTAAGSSSPTRPSILNAAPAAVSRTGSGGGGGGVSPLSPASRLQSRASSGLADSLPSTSAGASPKAGGRAQLPKTLICIPDGGKVAPAAAAPGGDGLARRLGRPFSGRLFAPPAPSLAGLDPELQQRLEAAGSQLDSSQWKERLAGVEALQAAAGGQAAAALPPGAQMWLADALARRVLDANLKVQQQALAALRSVLANTGDALALAAPLLLPAVCKCLESGNPPVRQTAGEALECVLGAWPATAHLPPLMATLGAPAGGARGKALLLDMLSRLAPALWQADLLLVTRHALPALFALLAAERRPELRQAVKAPLEALAACMPPGQLTAAAADATLAPAQLEVVAAAVAAAGTR